MSKTKAILLGVGIGLNFCILAFAVYYGYLWNYKRPIVQEVHTTQTYVTGPNATVSQQVDNKKDKNWFLGVFGGYKSGGVVVGKFF